MTLFALAAIAGSGGLLIAYIRYARRVRRKIENQANFVNHLYNSIPEGIFLVSAMKPYSFLQINNRGLGLLQYPDFSSFLEDGEKDFFSRLHPGDRKLLEKLINRAYWSNEKMVSMYRLKRQDGAYIWTGGVIERALDVSGREIFIATFHDITKERMEQEKKEREQSLERSALIGAISNVYPVIINGNLSLDTCQVVYRQHELPFHVPNESIFLARQFSGLIEQTATLVEVDAREEFLNRFRLEALLGAFADGKKEVIMEMRMLMSDFLYHWIFIQAIPLSDPYSKGSLVIMLARIIDERKQEEEQNRLALLNALDGANAANRAKSDFLSNMSHDMRTPMNAIIGMTEIAKIHIDKKERVLDCLKKITLSGTHLLELINEVLDMSKIESGKILLNEEPFRIQQELESIQTILAPQIKDKRLSFQIAVKGLLHDFVLGDPLRLRQILLNIAGNAVKFTPDGKRVLIEAWETDSQSRGYGCYIFRFSDEGIGISSEFLEKMFLPFEREANTTMSKMEGTGLGMAITKNLVKMMNGDIQVESELGKGSVFTVMLYLKINSSDGKQEKEAVQEIKREPSYQGKRLLLVEDNDLNMEIARELIGMMGIQIECAANGQEAFLKIEGHAPGYYDMVFMDVQMPVMNGYDATKKIRGLAREDVAALPIIAMTANAFAEDVMQAKNAGMNGHIAKPIDMDAVKKVMDRWLGA